MSIERQKPKHLWLRNGVWYSNVRYRGKLVRRRLSRDLGEATEMLREIMSRLRDRNFADRVEKAVEAFQQQEQPSTGQITEGSTQEAHILSRYSMSADEYNAALKRQGGLCAICREGPTGTGNKSVRLVVDHCHHTGEIRGLLCHRCNSALGKFHDDPERLFAALKYLLSRPNAISVCPKVSA
jgi:hypothetical protein